MKTEKQRWDEAAEEYAKKVESKTSQGFLIREKCLNPYLFKALGNIKNKKILDYGCGDGWLSNELKQKGAIVKGCDISEKFIKLAKQKYSNIEFKVINKKTPYEDSEFDIVVSNIVLHITKEYENVLNEIYRILKLNGKCIITIMHPNYYKEEQINLKKKEEKLEIKVEGSVPVIYYRRNPEIYENAFEDTGFKIIKKQECIAKKEISPELRKYSEKPFFLLYEMEKIITYAASAVIHNDKGRVLLAKRSPTKYPFPNAWSVPSISYKEGEYPKEKLKQALKRKLGIEIKINEILGQKEGKQKNYWLKMTDYKAEIVNGIPTPNKEDYSEVNYLDPVKLFKGISKEKMGFCVQVLLENIDKISVFSHKVK